MENIEYRFDINISNRIVSAASVLTFSICREAQVLFLMVDFILAIY